MTEKNVQTGENCETTDKYLPCPVCNRIFTPKEIEDHVNKCLFLNTANDRTNKRPSSSNVEHIEKKMKPSRNMTNQPQGKTNVKEKDGCQMSQSQGKFQTTPIPSERASRSEVKQIKTFDKSVPLAEQVRPSTLEEYVGQDHVLGKNKLLRSLLDKKDIPSMILWGPPGCGKTTLANIIACMCKNVDNLRFVKLSATMSGINDVKEVVKIAKNELKFKRRTILFMDEIHRFNKLQQDTFLPHVESGAISLVGATTENPSFSLNNALLSRCRVIILEKLNSKELLTILENALEKQGEALIVNPEQLSETRDVNIPRIIIEKSSLQWLADISDGDARIALSSLQLALQSKDPGDMFDVSGPGMITLDDIKDGIKRSHLLYDRKGEEHYNIISALHKSIRASDDNAALYWVTRMMEGGEDPIFIARRLVRAAGEDIGLADPRALQLAVSCLHGCQAIGMPECDVIIAECVVYLARAPKSTKVYKALMQCKKIIKECQGPLPAVPLHLRNAPTKLMKELGYAKGYNLLHKDESNLQYMPDGMENVNFF